MGSVKVRVSKTIQEVRYEPFTVDIELTEDNVDDDTTRKEITDKVEKHVDDKITERLNALEE